MLVIKVVPINYSQYFGMYATARISVSDPRATSVTVVQQQLGQTFLSSVRVDAVQKHRLNIDE